MEEKDENINESAQQFNEVSDLKDFDKTGSKLFLYYKLDENILEIEIMNEKHQILKAFDKEADTYLKEIFLSDLTIVSHYLKDLFVYCFYNNIKIPDKYYDTATAMYLLDSMKEKYDIDDTYRNHNISGSVNDPKPYKIKYLQKYSENEIKTTDMQSLFYDIELPLVEILAYMEYVGIRADREYLFELSEYFDNEINITAKKIFDYAGCTFNINSPKQLGIVLFEQLKLPHAKPNSSGGYSTSAEVLEKLKRYPIVEEILYYRTVSKLYSTYAQGLLSAILIDGRIHSKFNQTVTATGRISSTEPNMQNIPVRTEIGRKYAKPLYLKRGIR